MAKTNGDWDVFVARHNGTEIIVEDLFHNVPARKRFLKNNTTEFKHYNPFTQLSLVYPELNSTFFIKEGMFYSSEILRLGRFAEVVKLKDEQVKEPLDN